jgi:hypothetical protein
MFDHMKTKDPRSAEAGPYSKILNSAAKSLRVKSTLYFHLSPPFSPGAKRWPDLNPQSPGSVVECSTIRTMLGFLLSLDYTRGGFVAWPSREKHFSKITI